MLSCIEWDFRVEKKKRVKNSRQCYVPGNTESQEISARGKRKHEGGGKLLLIPDLNTQSGIKITFTAELWAAKFVNKNESAAALAALWS